LRPEGPSPREPSGAKITWKLALSCGDQRLGSGAFDRHSMVSLSKVDPGLHRRRDQKALESCVQTPWV
jgi:hypothetical protein